MLRRLFQAALLGAATAGAMLPAVAADSPVLAGEGAAARRLAEAIETIRRDRPDAPPPEQLVEAAIAGMLKSLDPYSTYLTPASFRSHRIGMEGAFGGIGIRMRVEPSGAVVSAVMPGTPADRVGLAAGDRISHVDGRPVAGLKTSEISRALRGEVGTGLTLTVVREDAAPFELRVERARVEEPTVTYRTVGTVGVVRLARFNGKASREVARALDAIGRELGDGLSGYVLDLRDNPGGLVREAVAVADLFLRGGTVVSTRGREPRSGEAHRAAPGDVADDLPVVVLVNGRSASASEIVAGALQDHGRALLMGTRSYGKGSVQTIAELEGGGALKLTTARYYTPAGRSIHGIGLTPDVEVAAESEPGAADAQLDRAVELLASIRRHPRGTGAAS